MNSTYIARLLGVVSGLLAVVPVAAQQTLKDSVIIAFNEQTRMVIYGTDRKEIEKLSQYDFNKLIRDVLAKLDSVPTDGVSKDWVDGNRYLKTDSVGMKQQNKEAPARTPGKARDVLMGREDDREKTVINITQTITEEDGYTEVVIDTVEVKVPRRWARRSPRQGIDFKVGLNTYGYKNADGYDLNDMVLRPGASRFVSIGIVRSLPVVKGKKNNLFMDLGLDVSWYNLMFAGDEVIRKESSGVVFVPVTGSNGQELELRRNKLVSPHVNLSVMPTYTFAGSVMSHISAGAYAGYRVGGHQMSHPYGGRKSRTSGDFHMQDARYGLALEVGIRSFPDLFVNYDLNTFFDPGKGPQVRMLSFGFRM